MEILRAVPSTEDGSRQDDAVKCNCRFKEKNENLC